MCDHEAVRRLEKGMGGGECLMARDRRQREIGTEGNGEGARMVVRTVGNEG